MDSFTVVSAIIAFFLTLQILRRLLRKTREVSFKRVTQESETVASNEGHAYNGPKIKALIAGGQGLLGKKLVQKLIEDGTYEVYSLDLYIPEPKDRLSGVHTYIQTDISREDDVMKALEGIQVVFMTASLQPSITISDSQMRKVNEGGARNIVKACKRQGVKRLVYTSSVSVTMGKNQKPHDLIKETEPFPTEPLNTYVKTKKNAELMILGANGMNGLSTVSLRLAGLMGGRCNPTAQWFVAPILAYGGDGNYNIDYVDVDSAVRAHIIAEKKLLQEQQEENLHKNLMASDGHNGGNRNGNGFSENGYHKTGGGIAGKAYIISMRDKCSLKELMEYCAQRCGRLRPIGIPYIVLMPIAYLNRLIYKTTGLVLIPLTKMHVEFLRAFNFVPSLAEKVLGWTEEMSWKEIADKAMKECNG